MAKKTVTASQVTQAEKQEAADEKLEAERKKKASELVGKLVHYWGAPAEGYNDDASEELECARREEDPVAAIITSVQPDNEGGKTIVNLHTWPPGFQAPAFGVDLVGSSGDGPDGTAFCVLI